MGFFSWKTSDTHESISNTYSKKGTFKVYMLTPKRRYVEDSYEGYGVFGGKDYYELVYELNKDIYLGDDNCESRIKGIMMAHDKALGGKLVLPRFAESADSKYEDLADSDSCPDQGFFYNNNVYKSN